jgi:outer membrane protein assembly factor BamB
MTGRGRLAGVAGGVLAALLVAACSGAPKPKPTPLQPLQAAIAGRVAWMQRLDGGFGPTAAIATAGDVFTVASLSGVVAALRPEDGREAWRLSLGKRLATGPGSDGRFTAVVAEDGELIVLAGGKVAWRRSLGVRSVTPPLVAGERIFVLGMDRSVRAFDALDGMPLWLLSRPGDPLLLAQVGVLLPFRDTLVVGQGTRLTGVDPLRGTVRWEVTMASPRGTNEIERLADLVGPAARFGNRICVRAFQSTVGCADAVRGTQAWTRTFGGTQGVEVDESFVFAVDASGRIGAWRAASGEPAWTQESLLHRDLSAPLSVGRTVVLGDVEGVVHFLSRDDGKPQLRLTTDGSPVVARPAAIGNTVLVATRSGGLHALRPN